MNKQLKIDPELHSRFKKAAKKRGMKLGFMAEQAIKQYLNNLEKIEAEQCTCHQ